MTRSLYVLLPGKCDTAAYGVSGGPLQAPEENQVKTVACSNVCLMSNLRILCSNVCITSLDSPSSPFNLLVVKWLFACNLVFASLASRFDLDYCFSPFFCFSLLVYFYSC